jgi:hypothetical protein
MKTAAVVLLSALCALPAGPPASAQGQLSGAASAPTRVDSAALLRDARREQQRFEIIRRNHLEQTWDRFGGDCDERVGRFCLTRSGGGDRDDWEAPAEAEVVGRARERLVGVLDEAAAVLPGDAWVAGQRVRYLAEMEEHARATDAARECRAERWWCTALLGFALHRGSDHAGAEAAFDSAVAVMPGRERRALTDISRLLEAGEDRRYRRAPAEERARLEHTYWWLSDPLWLMPGNDRLTEHRARYVMALLQDRARSTEGTAWGDDLHELLLRFGWPVAWKRQRQSSPSLQASTSIISFYAPRSRHFAPPLRLVETPASVSDDDWKLRERSARTAYAPEYVYRFHSEPPAHQIATFRRGDSTLVVAGLSLARDSMPDDSTVLAGLVVAPLDAQQALRIDSLHTRAPGARFRVLAPAGPVVVSLEAVAGDRWAARVRHGVAPVPLLPGVPALSGILLVEHDEDSELPASLDEAYGRMRVDTRIVAGSTLALFWEVYGLDSAAAEAATLAISMRRVDGGWLRRAAERVGLVGAETPVRLRWQEEMEPGDGVYARALTLGVPAEVAAGSYAVEVGLVLPGREPVTAVRVVRVER